MHYACLLITEGFPTKERIAEILKPFNSEDYSLDKDASKKRPVFTWDWYQIGGRYAARLKLRCVDEENPINYEWKWYAKQNRNGRLFWSHMLSDMKEYAKNSLMYSEEEYFSSMGSRDGFLYVDGAYINDLLNFDEVTAYCCVDKDGNAFATETWDGENWLDNNDYDAQIAKIKSESAGCFATIIDLHD